jgi:hypothetical protein
MFMLFKKRRPEKDIKSWFLVSIMVYTIAFGAVPIMQGDTAVGDLPTLEGHQTQLKCFPPSILTSRFGRPKEVS